MGANEPLFLGGINLGKRIAFKPLETITFEMRDEKRNIFKEVDFVFNNFALAIITDEFGDLNQLFKKYEKKPYDAAAILLYAGAKSNNMDFTLEEAREMVASGGHIVLSEVANLVIESLMIQGGEDTKKKFIDLMEKMGIAI